MQDTLSRLAELRRPRILMRAARHGAEDYRRTVHLPRLLGYGSLPGHNQALVSLIEIEDFLNTKRIKQEADYPLMRHIEVLIAILGEARILRATSVQAAPQIT